MSTANLQELISYLTSQGTMIEGIVAKAGILGPARREVEEFVLGQTIAAEGEEIVSMTCSLITSEDTALTAVIRSKVDETAMIVEIEESNLIIDREEATREVTRQKEGITGESTLTPRRSSVPLLIRQLESNCLNLLYLRLTDL